MSGLSTAPPPLEKICATLSGSSPAAVPVPTPVNASGPSGNATNGMR